MVKGEANRKPIHEETGDGDPILLANAPRMADLSIDTHQYLDWIHVHAVHLMALPEEKVPEDRKSYWQLLPLALAESPCLREAMADIRERIESATKQSLESRVWPEAGRQVSGADADDYIEYLKLLTKIAGGDPRTPVTLVAVVGERVLYWTTSIENLSSTLDYWEALRAEVKARRNATAGTNAAQERQADQKNKGKLNANG